MTYVVYIKDKVDVKFDTIKNKMKEDDYLLIAIESEKVGQLQILSEVEEATKDKISKYSTFVLNGSLETFLIGEKQLNKEMTFFNDGNIIDHDIEGITFDYLYKKSKKEK